MDTAAGLIFHRIAIVIFPLLLVFGEYTLYILREGEVGEIMSGPV
jgi:hypothetical protein